MSWSADTPLQRFRVGETAYLRCVVVGQVCQLNEPWAVVQLADKKGVKVCDIRRYAPESQLISVIDLIRASREMMR